MASEPKASSWLIAFLGAEDGGDRYARVWEHFAWRIGDDHLPELVEDLFDRILKRVAEDGEVDGKPGVQGMLAGEHPSRSHCRRQGRQPEPYDYWRLCPKASCLRPICTTTGPLHCRGSVAPTNESLCEEPW